MHSGAFFVFMVALFQLFLAVIEKKRLKVFFL